MDHGESNQYGFPKKIPTEIQTIISEATQDMLQGFSVPHPMEQEIQPEVTSTDNPGNMSEETLFPSDLVEDTLDLQTGAAQSITPLEVITMYGPVHVFPDPYTSEVGTTVCCRYRRTVNTSACH
jgi:hypothetical protein